MATTLSEIYRSKAFVLARTSVIKLNTIALMINDNLRDRGYEVDEDRPETWKYYLNLNGQYHQSDHDLLYDLSSGASQFMRIVIADNEQPKEVDLVKELFFGDNADLALANEYRFNQQYYNSLVTKYPDFTTLILGILNPVSFEISLGAKEGEILYCGGHLKTKITDNKYKMVTQDYGLIGRNFYIEDNEENLIPTLQKYVYGFLDRYMQVNYAVTHDLFYIKMLSDLYLLISVWIYNIRLSNVKSPNGFVHSFHLKSYLESNGRLGWVVDHIKRRESLWLYRNLEWLYANQGKQMVFKAIIDNILTPSNVPLSGYRLKHDVSKLGVDGQLYSVPFMEKEVLNISHTGSGSDHVTIKKIIDNEEPLAVENYYDQEGQAVEVSDASAHSMFDDVNTKVLESIVIDLSNNVVHTLEDVGLNLWLFTASHRLYTGTLFVTNPIANDRIQVTPLNAFILALYCLNMGYADLKLETIPNSLTARLIPRFNPKPHVHLLDKPTLEDMKWGTLEEYISDDVILEIMGDFVPDFTHRSADALIDEIVRQHTELMRRYYVGAKVEDMKGRAMADYVLHHQYWHQVPCRLTDEDDVPYDTWLVGHGIDFTGFGRSDYVQLGLALVEAATQLDTLRTDKLKKKQDAVLGILKHFMSYTVQIIKSVTVADSFITDFRTLRLGDVKSKWKMRVLGESVSVQSDLKGVKLHDGVIDLQDITPIAIHQIHESIKMKYDVSTDVGFYAIKNAQKERVELVRSGIVDAIIPDIVTEPVFPPVYRLYANKTVIVEGESVEFTLETENIVAGTVFNWIITGINSTDITPNVLEGTFVVNGLGIAKYSVSTNCLTQLYINREFTFSVVDIVVLPITIQVNTQPLVVVNSKLYANFISDSFGLSYNILDSKVSVPHITETAEPEIVSTQYSILDATLTDVLINYTLKPENTEINYSVVDFKFIGGLIKHTVKGEMAMQYDIQDIILSSSLITNTQETQTIDLGYEMLDFRFID